MAVIVRTGIHSLQRIDAVYQGRGTGWTGCNRSAWQRSGKDISRPRPDTERQVGTLEKSSSTPKKRRPGPPKGNKNAVKHGFYSRLYQGDEATRIGALEDKYSLDGEIDLLRVCIDRLAEQLEFTKETYTITGKAGETSEIPDDYNLKALNTFSTMLSALGTLIRTHYVTRGKGGAIEGDIMQALEEMRLEMGL